MKNRVLYTSVLSALVGFSGLAFSGFASAQAPSPVQAVSNPAPSVVPTAAPTAPTASAPTSAPAAQVVINTPNANVLVPQPAPSAGVSTLQQTLNNNAQQGTASSGVSFATSDESTLLREMSRQQARLAFLNMLSKIEKAQLDIERDRLKFEQEKREAEAAIQKVSAPALSVPAGPSSAGTPSIGTAAELVASISKPSVRSIYSYDGAYFAEIFTDNQKTIARAGTVLPNGSRVISINASGVVVSHKGKRMTLSVEPPSSVLSTSSSGPLSTPSSAPSALPPIPR